MEFYFVIYHTENKGVHPPYILRTEVVFVLRR
jgi:hypothetical protein